MLHPKALAQALRSQQRLTRKKITGMRRTLCWNRFCRRPRARKARRVPRSTGTVRLMLAASNAKPWCRTLQLQAEANVV